jgi:MerR family transcriptional regulator, redox-sensitive transcriptional activator SoxR
MAVSQGLSIGAVAARTGLAVFAIRFYETHGLVTPINNALGHRRYDRSNIRKLSFFMIAQELGVSLKNLGMLMQPLPQGCPPSKGDWTRLATKFRKDIDARIAKAERLRGKLDGCIGCGWLSLSRCALYNPQNGVRMDGTGPRY